ncbi:MAG: hypothetical protein ACU4EQ_08265 [Candidatus Nitrosoglobus sp.]
MKHYSIRTEQACVDGDRRYIPFHDQRHPCQLGVLKMKAFMDLPGGESKSASLNAEAGRQCVPFLCKEILLLELPKVERPRLQNI